MALEIASEGHASKSLTSKLYAIFIDGFAKLEVIFVFFVLMTLSHIAVTHVTVYYL
jgi:hypothetical protein